MTRKYRWMALGIGLGIALQASREAPATLLPWLLQSSGVTRVQLADLRGSLWNGSARVRLAAAGTADFDLQRWYWRLGLGAWLQPWLQLSSTPLNGSDVRPGMAAAPPPGAGRPEGTLALSPGWHGLTLHAVNLQVPADALPLPFAWWSLLQARGRLQLRATALTLDAGGLQGMADVDWQDAQVAQSPLAPLGSWQVQCTAEGWEGHYRLRTLRGPLTLNGEGRFALDGRFSLQGFAQADAASSATLQPLLGMLGAPDDRGRVAIALPWRAAP